MPLAGVLGVALAIIGVRGREANRARAKGDRNSDQSTMLTDALQNVNAVLIFELGKDLYTDNRIVFAHGAVEKLTGYRPTNCAVKGRAFSMHRRRARQPSRNSSRRFATGKRSPSICCVQKKTVRAAGSKTG